MKEIYPYSRKTTKCDTGEVILDEKFDLRLTDAASIKHRELIELSKKDVGVYWTPVLPKNWDDLSQEEKSRLTKFEEFDVKVDAIYCRAPISIQELKMIVKYREIESLHIRQSSLSNSDLRYIDRLANLTGLLLRGEQFTDECVKYLFRCRKLSNLDIFETSISVEGEADLKQHLPGCEIWSSNHC